MTTLLVWAAAAAFAASPGAGGQGQSEISQDITVKGKAGGPSLALPPPAASKPVIEEVLHSLSLGRKGELSAQPTVRVTPEMMRFERPFPEPPFLAFSPENIRALYDDWTFEVRSEDGQIVSHTEGVGSVRETLDWEGSGVDGRLAVSAGHRYHYRFTGRRGGREFAIESDPVLLKSFTRRQYGGETRLEAAIDEIFPDGKAAFATGAERYLDVMADALRAGDARADGSYRFELYGEKPRGKLAAARLAALVDRFSSALGAESSRIQVSLLPSERGPALAAFVPPAKGERLRNE
jgi:hypothetical protein